MRMEVKGFFENERGGCFQGLRQCKEDRERIKGAELLVFPRAETHRCIW